MSSSKQAAALDCDYLLQDLAAYKDENARLAEIQLQLDEQCNLLQQKICELEAEALIQQQTQHEDNTVQKQFSTLFDESPAVMLLTNKHGDIEMLNQAACQMLNQSRDSLIGQNLRKFLQKQSSYDLLNLYLTAEESQERLAPSNHLFVLKTEQMFSLSMVKLSHQGQFGGYYLLTPMLINLKDVSNQSLRLSNIIIDQIREGLMVTDASGKIVRINHAFSEITGFSEQEVDGQTASILHSGRHSKAFYDRMWTEIQHHGWWAGEIWNRRKSGEIFPEWLQISRIHDQQTGQLFYVATFSDITDRKTHQNQLDRLAFYDSLTGLPNRSMLHQFLDAQVSRTHEDHPYSIAVLFLDLDKFKEVNDHYGHAEGDQILREATQRITARIRESDIATRIGGDEFVIVLTRLQSAQEAELVAKDLLKMLSEPYQTKKSTHRLSASIGIAFAPMHGNNVEDLMRRADAAMYRAKQLGRNAFQIFDQQDENIIIESNQMLKLLWQAVEKPIAHIQMHYQPIYTRNNTQHPTHYEALVRLVDDNQNLIYPDLFISLAEQNGVINAFGMALFEAVCADIQKHQIDPNIKIAVNLSPVQFHQENFINELKRIAGQYEHKLDRFYFEVTETATIQNVHLISGLLSQMKDHGSMILLDDFGTGFASLSILKSLPVDILKIDRSFIQELEHSVETQSMIKAMIAMAKALGLKVVTEGVETQQQLDWLAEHEVDFYQGYLLGRPKGL